MSTDERGGRWPSVRGAARTIPGTRAVRVLAVAALVVGVAAPAAAEGYFTGDFRGGLNAWDSHESRTWLDKNIDGTNGYAQFTNCATENDDNDFAFYVKVMKEDFGPDTKVAGEWMDCVKFSAQTQDRVWFGDQPRDEYHFTINSCYLRAQCSGDGTGHDSNTLYVDSYRVQY